MIIIYLLILNSLLFYFSEYLFYYDNVDQLICILIDIVLILIAMVIFD